MASKPTQETNTASSHKEPSKTLVIDTNVFLKHPNFQSLLQEYEVLTTKSVISELRDPRAKHRAKLHFKEYKIVNPEKKHIQRVMNFAKATGDFVSLSVADIEVVALAVQKIIENGNEDKIRNEPKKAVNCMNKGGRNGIVDKSKIIEVVTGTNKEEEENGDENKEQIGENKQNEEQTEKDEVKAKVEEAQPKGTNQETETNAKDGENDESEEHKPKDVVEKVMDTKLWQEGKDWDLEDEEGWITKDNLNKLISSSVLQDAEKEALGVCCMTSDFAMQNIILQMGIPLKAHNGRIIKRVKSYILECFSCFTVTRNTEKKFCPGCGNATLLKVTCSFKDDGTMILYRKKGHKVNLRGTRYNIPNPKFGRVNDDLILTEDQYNNKRVIKKKAKAEKWRAKQTQNAEMAYSNGWGFDAVSKQNKNFKNFVVGYGRANPNSNTFRAKQSRKKHNRK